MPQLKTYRKNSIVYFEGDNGKNNEGPKEIFLIKEGKVLLTFKNITGDAVENMVIGKGEFFGIRTAITHLPREERATCIEDCEMLIFSIPEFEELVKKTPAIGLKILKMLSFNLRQIGKEEKKLVSQNAFEDPGSELFKMGLYFFNQRAYNKAIQVWNRMKQFYPDHHEIVNAEQMIKSAQEALKTGYHPTITKK